jgi:hypothetical protein
MKEGILTKTKIHTTAMVQGVKMEDMAMVEIRTLRTNHILGMVSIEALITQPIMYTVTITGLTSTTKVATSHPLINNIIIHSLNQ